MSTGLLTTLWHDVNAPDPLTLAASAVLTSAVALGAAWFPADRVARRNPCRAPQ